MLRDEELREEWERDELNELRAEELKELEMQSDFDYALKTLGFNEDITVAELAQTLHTLKQLGYDISANELMDLIWA